MLQKLKRSNIFPTKISDLNLIGQKLIPMNQNFDSLEYTDIEYRQRRLVIGAMSKGHTIGAKIKQVEYTELEHETWRKALKKLYLYQQNVMSAAYLNNLNELQKILNFSSSIPKINDLSNFLKSKSGFQIKPVPGMIDQRQFLSCLAFKIFCSGQFIRHPKCIDFTTEPDIIHEYVGHVPMFADPHIAQFSQQLGLLSLGASDADIQKIGRAYLYTIQLGLCLENSQQKVFGAGIAACAADLKKVMQNRHTWKKFDPQTDLKNKVDNFQKPFECFYLSESIQNATQALLELGNNIKRPFRCQYDQGAQEIKIDFLE